MHNSNPAMATTDDDLLIDDDLVMDDDQMMDDIELEPPDSHERFHLERMIGRGGTGEVHEAQLYLADGGEKRVAVKILRDTPREESGRLRRFVDHVAPLAHPNVSLPMEFIASSAGRVLVYEYHEGLSLIEVMRRLKRKGRPLPMVLALEIITQALEGLVFLHKIEFEGMPVLHESIKPSNLFIGTDGGVKVLDAGLMNPMASPEGRSKGLAVINVLPYLAPEQLAELPKSTQRTDLYSLGTIAYELLAGRLLFDGSAARRELEIRVGFGVQDKLRALETVKQGIAPILSRIVALAPADRYVSATEMFRDLVALRGEPQREQLGELVKELREMPDFSAMARARGDDSTIKLNGSAVRTSEILSMFEAPTVPRAVEPVPEKILKFKSPRKVRRRESQMKIGMAVLCLAIAFGALWWVDQSRTPESHVGTIVADQALSPAAVEATTDAVERNETDAATRAN